MLNVIILINIAIRNKLINNLKTDLKAIKHKNKN
jgi:hypothetical protein